MTVENVKTWFQELIQSSKDRFGDVFLSYFITFSILLNWKFLFTLLIRKPDVSDNVIVAASKLYVPPTYYENLLELLGHPTKFTLALLFAFGMSVFYPFFSGFISLSRKIVFNFWDRVLQSDFPSRAEYKGIMAENKSLKDQVAQSRNNFLSGLSYVSDMFTKENHFIKRSNIHFTIAVGEQGISFLNDEIVRISNRNPMTIEKKGAGRLNKDYDHIVVHTLPSGIFFVAKIGDEVPVTETMRKRGCKKFVADLYGQPQYLSEEIDPETEKSTGAMFYINIPKDQDFAKVQLLGDGSGPFR